MKELIARLWYEPQTVRKLLVALVATAISAIALGVLPGALSAYVALAAQFLGALGVYATQNGGIPRESQERRLDYVQD